MTLDSQFLQFGQGFYWFRKHHQVVEVKISRQTQTDTGSECGFLSVLDKPI